MASVRGRTTWGSGTRITDLSLFLQDPCGQRLLGQWMALSSHFLQVIKMPFIPTIDLLALDFSKLVCWLALWFSVNQAPFKFAGHLAALSQSKYLLPSTLSSSCMLLYLHYFLPRVLTSLYLFLFLFFCGDLNSHLALVSLVFVCVHLCPRNWLFLGTDFTWFVFFSQPLLGRIHLCSSTPQEWSSQTRHHGLCRHGPTQIELVSALPMTTFLAASALSWPPERTKNSNKVTRSRWSFRPSKLDGSSRRKKLANCIDWRTSSKVPVDCPRFDNMKSLSPHIKWWSCPWITAMLLSIVNLLLNSDWFSCAIKVITMSLPNSTRTFVWITFSSNVGIFHITVVPATSVTAAISQTVLILLRKRTRWPSSNVLIVTVTSLDPSAWPYMSNALMLGRAATL